MHGFVQGVGFRFATAREAESRNVAGWVRNRPDGTVEAVFEGEPDAVLRALLAVARRDPVASPPLPETGDEAIQRMLDSP